MPHKYLTSPMRKILQKHGLLLNTWDRYAVPKLSDNFAPINCFSAKNYLSFDLSLDLYDNVGFYKAVQLREKKRNECMHNSI